MSIYYAYVSKIICRALLFDLDGVLVDSTAAVTRVWSGWAAERGFSPEETVARAHGRPSLTTIRELLPHADHEAENRVVERREIEDLDGVIAAPGAKELLSALPAEVWALVTSCTRPLAAARLRAAGLPVPKFIVTSSDITHGKPHPEPYLKGTELVGFPPQQCVVVEDAPAGIRSGKAAGARVIALRTTMPDQVLEAAGPDWITESCASLLVARASLEHGISLSIK